MVISFPEVCRTDPADDFLLAQINKFYAALEERDVEIGRLQQEVRRLKDQQRSAVAVDAV